MFNFLMKKKKEEMPGILNVNVLNHNIQSLVFEAEMPNSNTVNIKVYDRTKHSETNVLVRPKQAVVLLTLDGLN